MEDTRIGSFVAALDAFPKFDTAYLERTRSGGLASLLTFGILAALSCAEFWRWAVPETTQHYIVDPLVGHKVKLEVDISVASECQKLVIMIAEETAGTRLVNDQLEAHDEDFDSLRDDWVEKLKSTRMDTLQNSNSDDSWNSDAVKVMGCRIKGTILANKAGGQLMILPMMTAMGPIGQFLSQLDKEINFSHYIHHLSFGPEVPGVSNPLNGSNQLAMEAREHFTYFLSIIPTIFNDKLWPKYAISTNQYTLNGFKGKKGIQDSDNPGLFFKYNHEPLALIITRERIPFLSFIVHVVGIIGGIYTCSALIHNTLHSLWKMIIGLVISRNPSKNGAKRFDAGWSPVQSSSGGGERPRIVKSISLSNENSDKALLFDPAPV